MKRIPIIATLIFVFAAPIAQTGFAQVTKQSEEQGLRSLTKDEHQRLAAQYRSKAEQFLAKAAEHEKMAATARTNPTPWQVKNPSAFGPQHHLDLAAHYREKASKTQSLANTHENMATAAR